MLYYTFGCEFIQKSHWKCTYSFFRIFQFSNFSVRKNLIRAITNNKHKKKKMGPIDPSVLVKRLPMNSISFLLYTLF